MALELNYSSQNLTDLNRTSGEYLEALGRFAVDLFLREGIWIERRQV